MSEEGQDATAPDVEEQAREVGWVPKDEWKGKPDYWKPASEWLERAPKTYIPKLEKEIGKLRGQIAKQETDFADRLKRLESTTARGLKSERERMEREYEARILKATELGDTEAVKRAMTDQKKDMAGLEAKVEKAEDKQEDAANDPAKDLSPTLKKRLEDWLDDNDWYYKSKVLQKRWDAYFVEIQEDQPGLSLDDQMDAAKRRLVKRFPEKFGKEADAEEEDTPRRGSRVEGGSRNSNGGGSKKQSWTDIPSEDRAIAKSMIGEGKLFKDQADYAKAYFEEQAA